jgi:hypothetical protein
MKFKFYCERHVLPGICLHCWNCKRTAGENSLKYNPELAIEMREQHPEVLLAWFFNKVIMDLRYSVIISLRLFRNVVHCIG